MIELPGREVRSRFGLPGSLGKRAVARLIRFAVLHQETVNERLVAAIAELRDVAVALEHQAVAGRDALEHRIVSGREALEHQIAAGREALATLVTSVDRRIEDLRARTIEADEAQTSRIAVLRRELAAERAVGRKLSFAQTLLEERIAAVSSAEDERQHGIRRDADRLAATFAGLAAKYDETERQLTALSESVNESSTAATVLRQTLAVNVALVRELQSRQATIDERMTLVANVTEDLRAALLAVDASIDVSIDVAMGEALEKFTAVARDDGHRESIAAKFDMLERRLDDVRTMQQEDAARMADILGAIDSLTNASREMAALVSELNEARRTHAAVAAEAAIHAGSNGTASYANGTASTTSNESAPYESAVGALDAKINATPYMARDVFEAPGNDAATAHGGFDYLGFEEIFRGPEDFIKERQRAYLQFFPLGSHVLDAGCGRGEMLELLAEARVDATGVDINEAMVARCRAKGLENVVRADVLAYLDAEPRPVFDAIFSAQVIEHLGFEGLYAFCERALRSLSRDGIFIAETVNPNCFEALKMFHVDPTHHHPLFPETMRFLCRSAGFRDARIFYPTGDGFDEREPCRRGEYAVVAWK